jgi:hypothetical protein
MCRRTLGAVIGSASARAAGDANHNGATTIDEIIGAAHRVSRDVRIAPPTVEEQ